jgi:hypothetical protein
VEKLQNLERVRIGGKIFQTLRLGVIVAAVLNYAIAGKFTFSLTALLKER